MASLIVDLPRMGLAGLNWRDAIIYELQGKGGELLLHLVNTWNRVDCPFTPQID